MSTALDDLDPAFRPRAHALLARLVEARIPVVITYTRRTQEAQDLAVATGHSEVMHSRHQDGMAMDVAPIRSFENAHVVELQWNGTDPRWQRIGVFAEALGLRWGGRFGERPPGAGNGWDKGHVEVPA